MTSCPISAGDYLEIPKPKSNVLNITGIQIVPTHFKGGPPTTGSATEEEETSSSSNTPRN